MPFDTVIRGASVVDGTGRPAVVTDVALSGNRIVAVGPLPNEVEAASVIDAAGCVVAPGFVDIHTHSDVALLQPGAGTNKICQGVTTEIVGNCGFSAFPVDRQQRQAHADHLAYLGPDRAELAWEDLAGYVDALEAAHPIMNTACLVGHGTLRIVAVGLSERPLDDRQQARLAWLLDQALEQGAFGFSTGLTYVPSMFGDAEEITMLARVAARRGAADLVLLRPDRVADRATFAQSTELPVGIETVWVNGTVTVEHGRWNGASAGEVLRRVS